VIFFIKNIYFFEKTNTLKVIVRQKYRAIILTYDKNDVHLRKQYIMKIIPLTPNTGGILHPDQVIGRNLNVSEMIEILKRQSINLNAFRRSGKSSLLAKLNKSLEEKDDFVSIYLEVEGISNCDSFIEKLYQKFKDEEIIEENAIQKIDKAFDNLLGRFSKIGLPGFSAELNKRRQLWEKQLDELLKAVIKSNPNKLVIISLDEFSIMLDKIEDKGEASELIGILRATMHNEPFKESIRFIYCGSIGIDLVLDKLKKAGNNIGQPLNTMYDYVLEPLTSDNALYLARCFDLGCDLKLSEKNMIYICELSENIPYYIDFIFSLIRYKPRPSIDKDTIQQAYLSMLNDSNDKAEFKHFYERITLHYPEKDTSLSILNFLSKNTQPKTETDILNHISTQKETTRQSLIDELDRLRTDDYLSRETIEDERTYKFKYEILRMWWKLNKSF